MKRLSSILMVMALLTLRFESASAQRTEPCRPQGATRGCSANDRPGHQMCEGGVWTMCIASPPPPPKPVTGNITLKYYVLAVIYAPPGTNGGKSSSSVTYGSTSTLGSTVSSSDSFKNANSLSVTASQGVLGSAQVGVSFGYSSSSSHTQTFDVKKSVATEINVPGPPADGVNHDDDQIWLVRNPTVQVTLFPTASGEVSKINWRLEDSTKTPIYLYVKQLKDPSQIPPGVLTDLQAAGISAEDYQEILRADPYAFELRRGISPPPATPDPARFQLIAGFPYEPPAEPNGPVPLQKYNVSETDMQSSSSSTQNETTVGLTASGGADFAGLFNVAMKDQNNWTWTNTDTRSSSTGATETASLTIGGPAFGYAGPIDLLVYYDVVYRTFLFAFEPPTIPPTLIGVVKDAAGKTVNNKEVLVTTSGRSYRTATNAKGQYRAFLPISGPVRIQVASTTKDVTHVPANRRVDLVLSR